MVIRREVMLKDPCDILCLHSWKAISQDRDVTWIRLTSGKWILITTNNNYLFSCIFLNTTKTAGHTVWVASPPLELPTFHACTFFFHCLGELMLHFSLASSLLLCLPWSLSKISLPVVRLCSLQTMNSKNRENVEHLWTVSHSWYCTQKLTEVGVWGEKKA